ncbi:MAG: hypothetical protein Q4D96_10480 [Propionibacteriaceae bacterium]|nr:hypothetical protein [Propionibacteriaceae bacterium]
MTKRQAPAEKKALDRRRRIDSWGENQKSSRRNIPLRRRRLEKAHRRRVSAELRLGVDAEPGAIRREAMHKWAGETLADAIDRKLERRARDADQPRRSVSARARRAARRHHRSRH